MGRGCFGAPGEAGRGTSSGRLSGTLAKNATAPRSARIAFPAPGHRGLVTIGCVR